MNFHIEIYISERGSYKMKNKISKVQILRHIIQLIALVLSPGLFILAYGEMKSIYEMITSGNFNFIQSFPSLIELVTIILGTVLLGRFFCGWICAFGAFNDLLHTISKRIFKINFKVNEKVDAVLKYVKYVILLMLIVVSWTMGSKIFESSNPWDVFAQITDFPQVLFDYSIGAVLLALITIGAIFIERFFCRYLCPLGALFNIVSRISIFNIKKPSDKCGKCRLCTNNCSMGLKLYEKNSVCGGDCINCFKCVDACPRKNAQANILGENINPALASSFAIAAMTGVYAVSNLAGTALVENGMASASVTNIAVASNVNNAAQNSEQKYIDGTYTGTGTGFRNGTTKVSVTVENGKITNIKTISNQDTPKFYQRVESTMFGKIISAQAVSVDTVSGATFSSKGIIDAVKDALKGAVASTTSSATVENNTKSDAATENNTTTENSSTSLNTNAAKSDAAENINESVSKTNGTANTSENASKSINNETSSSNSTSQVNNGATNTTNSTEAQSKVNNSQTSNNSNSTDSNTKTANSTSTSAVAQSKYKDGTYTGTGTGFKGGKTAMEVTIKDDKIVSVKTVSNQDTPSFFKRVESTMINKILSSQSTSVDTVSGATYSSKGIINGVQAALNKAKL